MKTTYYLDIFKRSADRFDKQLFDQKNLEYKVGVWLKSVVLKIQKKSWINTSPTAKPFEESIFFSVWLNDESIGKRKLYYNIHALKLRQLADYSVKSREFAEAFRLRFKAFEKEWPNVNVNFGPLTLMEGWVIIDEENLEDIISELAYKFSEIAFIIDDLLAQRKK